MLSGTATTPQTLKGMKPMMRRFDLDTIAALAEGRLDPSDAAALEAAIAADPRAAAELTRQRLALSVLHEAPEPSLTDSERSILHSAVASALGIEDGAILDRRSTAATGAGVRLSPPGEKRIPWGAIGVAAVGLAALVMVVPVADMLSSGGDDSAGATTFAEAAVATAEDGTDTSESAREPSAAIPEEDLKTSESTTITTVAATEVTTTEAATVTAGADPLETVLMSELAAVRSDPDQLATLTAAALPEAACAQEAGALLADVEFDHFEYVPTEEAGAATGYVVYFAVPAEADPVGTLYAFPVDDCTSPVEIP